MTNAAKDAFLNGVIGTGTATLTPHEKCAWLEAKMRVRISHNGNVCLELVDERHGEEIVLFWFDVPTLPGTTVDLDGLRGRAEIKIGSV
jgi:hypothetical protein